MDPLSAFGLAINILTFIDYSYKVLSTTSEIVERGKINENDDLEVVVNDLHDFNDKLMRPVKGTSEHEAALQSLAAKCQSILEDLQKVLEKLQVEKGALKIKQFALAVRSMYHKQGIVSRIKALDQYRGEILLRLTAMLNERQVAVQMQISSIQADMKRDTSTIAKQLKGLDQQLQIVRKDWTSLEVAQRGSSSSIATVQESLGQLLRQSTAPTSEIRILKQLYYNDIYFREDHIEDSSSGTFQWLLDEEEPVNQVDTAEFVDIDLPGYAQEQEHRFWESYFIEAHHQRLEARSTLLTWLATENGLFHISGRAGSGKSTLMKMVLKHDRTKRELKNWAGDKQLVIAQFFFYRAGTTEARSLHGLYRSILFKILVQCPNLIPEVFPEAYEAFERSALSSSIDEIHFRIPQLHRTMELFISLSARLDYRFCFLIDGLDEFGENDAKPNDHDVLAKNLLSWTATGNVKLLVSSRPYSEFISTFSSHRNIHLHELNEFDILHFSRQKFESNKYFPRVKAIYKTFLKDICQRSNGIFLWAHLVVGQLLHRLGLGESVASVRKQLDQTPQNVSELYQQMLNFISINDRNKSFRIFWLGICYRSKEIGRHLPLIAITWVDDLIDDADFPSSSDIRAYPIDEIQEREASAELQLNYYTKGLLETSHDPHGDRRKCAVFLHRTVYDFIRENEDLLLHVAKYPDFTKSFVYIRIELACLWHKDPDPSGEEEDPDGPNDRLWRWHDIILNQGPWSDIIVSNRERAHIWFNAFRTVVQHHLNGGSKYFRGSTTCIQNGSQSLRTHRCVEFSWLHWMIFIIHDEEFLISQLEGVSYFFDETKALSCLFTAIEGRLLFVHPKQYQVIDYLLRSGVSPVEQFSVMSNGTQVYASAWQILCIEIGRALISSTTLIGKPVLLKILERFLQTKEVERDVLILITHCEKDLVDGIDETDASHAVTLLDLVQQRDPGKDQFWATQFQESNATLWTRLQRAYRSLAVRDMSRDAISARQYPRYLCGALPSQLGLAPVVHSVIIRDKQLSARMIEARVF